MSLREALRAAVARCAPQVMQRATTPADDATASATGVQQGRDFHRQGAATADATTAQLGSCTPPATHAPVVAPSCTPEVDTRVTCLTCAHYRPGRCRNHRAALLWSGEIGPALAALPQHCPAWMANDRGTT